MNSDLARFRVYDHCLHMTFRIKNRTPQVLPQSSIGNLFISLPPIFIKPVFILGADTDILDESMVPTDTLTEILFWTSYYDECRAIYFVGDATKANPTRISLIKDAVRKDQFVNFEKNSHQINYSKFIPQPR